MSLQNMALYDPRQKRSGHVWVHNLKIIVAISSSQTMSYILWTFYATHCIFIPLRSQLQDLLSHGRQYWPCDCLQLFLQLVCLPVYRPATKVLAILMREMHQRYVSQVVTDSGNSHEFHSLSHFIIASNHRVWRPCRCNIDGKYASWVCVHYHCHGFWRPLYV